MDNHEKNIFGHVHQEILNWYKDRSGPFFLDGVTAQNYSLIFFQLLQRSESALKNHRHLIVCKDNESAEDFFEALGSILSSDLFTLLFFPCDGLSPYTGGSTSQQDLMEKFKILGQLATEKDSASKKTILVTTIAGLGLVIPPKQFFIDEHFILKKEMTIDRDELFKKLHKIGYQNVSVIDEQATFSAKGEITDIFPVGSPPIRITFFDDIIESIYPIDQNTQKSLRDKELLEVLILPGPMSAMRSSVGQANIRKSLPVPTPQFPIKFASRKKIFEALAKGEWFYEIPNLMPLAFSEGKTILDYIALNDYFVSFVEETAAKEMMAQFQKQLEEEYKTQLDSDESSSFWPPPEFFFRSHFSLERAPTLNTNFFIADRNETKTFDHLSLGLEPSKNFLNRKIKLNKDQHNFVKDTFAFLNEEFSSRGQVFFVTKNDKGLEEIKYLLDSQNLNPDILNRIHFLKMYLNEGFYSPLDHSLFLSDHDLFGAKRAGGRKSSAKKTDLFADQLSTLRAGDFIVHAHHGLGKFVGVTTLAVGGQNNDFVVVEYEDGDKIYVPVYKLNIIQKHADAGTDIKIANLKNNKFEQIKARAKESAKKLAFDLIKLQAERAAAKAHEFSPPDHYFHEFELAFPFDETEDQLKAIEDVLTDMQKNSPMDRLVCGDVGFGKTEVAMRAAFKAVQDQKQVAVLVPTTILALQHYHTFTKRFKNFPVKIEYLSRFRPPAESKKIVADLAAGKVDILIGTHKILSQQVTFSDLGLVIVDEEQRFGVNHKEKLKSLKSNVDFLTLTATPIPRTLQMAFLGIRDLSTIQTPPAGRQSIKSFIIKQEDETIRLAIQKELGRGGQVFYVHNRINDIEFHVQKIHELVSNAKVIVAHGQLPEGELEKRMLKFYKGEANVLVSTTIIESGIDIPNANTIIIDRADTYGLSQLHQLRGRIGRSERKAYAYFCVPATSVLSEIAEKRIRALQTYAELGGGFALASADLDIRGAGDILGADQSGHIEEVGLELYFELLKEAVAEIKKEKVQKRREVEIQLSAPAFIPAQYIPDSSLRLKYYKKLSNCIDEGSLNSIEEELRDVFGPLPEETLGLLLVLKIRNVVHGLGIIAVKVVKDSVHFRFDKNFINSSDDLAQRLIQLFMSRPKVYQITPDYSVIYKHKVSVGASELLQISKDIAQQVEPC